jgi:hypothetical protein
VSATLRQIVAITSTECGKLSQVLVLVVAYDDNKRPSRGFMAVIRENGILNADDTVAPEVPNAGALARLPRFSVRL